MTSGLILLHQRHFNSLDFCYMGGLLDDAAGGPRDAVLALCQVGQGHCRVDLLPVRLVFALHLLLLHSAKATPSADNHSTGSTARKNTQRRRR